MNRDANEIEQAVSRTLRDSLEKLQRNTEDLKQAVSDLIAACGSARPDKPLSPMLRAQTSAASLAASLEVLQQFMTSALKPVYASVSPMQDMFERQAPAAQPAAPVTSFELSEALSASTARGGLC